MAEHKVNGGDMLLFIDPLGGTNYDTVVCLTYVGISDSVQPVDASSACGPDKSPGAVDMSISFEGQHLHDPNTGDISGTDLRILLRAEQTIGWKLSPVSPVAGDEIQEGTGYLSELSSTYSYSEVGSFSGTIQPYGMPTTTTQSGRFSFRVNTNQLSGEINIASSSYCDFVIYWGDGTSDSYNTDSLPLTHTYPSLGYYIVEIENLSPSTNMIFFDSGFDIDNVNNLSSFFSGTGIQASQLVIVNSNISSSDVNNILHQCISIPAINQSGVIINLSGNTPPAPPTGQGLIDKATLESNGVSVTVDATSPVLNIGDSYQGGKIAYIDGSGIHGIIVANQTYDIEWCINTGTLFYANYTVYGAGDLNNSIILSNAVPVTSSAAYVTDVYTNDGYSDWYMPTYDDCGLMYAGLSACGYGTLGTWSGTEFDGNFAYLMDNTGSIGLGAKDSVNTIIPIRYF